jgi:hypothetical protein
LTLNGFGCIIHSIEANKEVKMSHQEFESNVCYLVRPLLNDNEHAGFFADTGTLFAECSEETARNIFHKLSKEFGLDKVQINGPVQGEYSYDFE